jgi:PAS domain-containing protein
LRRSEEQYRALVTASSEVLYRMSPDWSEMRQLHSRGFLADMPKPSKDWLRQYIPPDDQPAVLAAIRKAIDSKSMFELEHRVLRADGAEGWTFSRAVPLMDGNGAITEWFGAASDITGRKQAEEELSQLKKRLAEHPASNPEGNLPECSETKNRQ